MNENIPMDDAFCKQISAHELNRLNGDDTPRVAYPVISQKNEAYSQPVKIPRVHSANKQIDTADLENQQHTRVAKGTKNHFFSAKVFIGITSEYSSIKRPILQFVSLSSFAIPVIQFNYMLYITLSYIIINLCCIPLYRIMPHNVSSYILFYVLNMIYHIHCIMAWYIMMTMTTKKAMEMQMMTEMTMAVSLTSVLRLSMSSTESV